jgi:hypothetical protein
VKFQYVVEIRYLKIKLITCGKVCIIYKETEAVQYLLTVKRNRENKWGLYMKKFKEKVDRN